MEAYYTKEDLKNKVFANRFYIIELDTASKKRCNRTTKVFMQLKKDLSLIEVGKSYSNSASWAGHVHEANKIIHKTFNYKLKNNSYYDGFIKDLKIIKPYIGI